MVALRSARSRDEIKAEMDEFSEDDRKALLHQNQPYDESLEVPDAEEIASTYSPTPRVPNPSVKAREALQLNRQDLGHSRGNSPPQSAMSDQSDDPYEDKPSQPQKKKGGSKGGSLRRQTLLSARSQKKAASQEEGDQEAPAPSNQVVTPQAPDAAQPLLPQLGPRPPQGVAGPGAGQPAPPGQHPPQQQQQPQPGMPQRPQMMPQQQRMVAGMRVPQAPTMPRIPSQQMPPQQQAPQMRAQQQQQMTMQQAAMRARAQMYGGQMQMAQMAQMAYMQRMQMMQMAQMGYRMQRHPQPATAPAGGGSEEEEDDDDDDDEDDSEEDEDSDEEEEEESMDEEEEGAGRAVMEPPQPDMEAGDGEEEAPKSEEGERPPVQQTPPETQAEAESREKKAESQKPKKEGKEKEEKPAEEKDAAGVAKPSKKKKSKKPKRSTKREIPPIRVRGVLRSHTDPGGGLGMPSPFGAPREALPDIAGVKKQPQQPIPASRGAAPQSQQFNSEDDDDDEDDEDDSDDDDDDDEHPQVEGAYDPAEFENLSVTAEIKELFQYITRYTPQSIELDHKLKPFIPDFIPSVGDIDAFIKIPRPDNKPDTLGLTVLDEPCAKQSDPTVLDLQLRAISKQTTAKTLVVKSLESAEKNPKAIENWIESIRDLHRSKPPPNVHYSRNMPDIDTLMQEWPPEFEELLKEVSLPTADLDCDLGQFTEIICSILDIPVYKTSSHQNEKIQALHVLFTLYSEFKNSQHFQALAANNQLDNALKDGAGDQLFL